MYRRFCFVLLGLLILPGLLLAGTTGKVRGKVVDSQSKEPLPGANVTLEGTSLGAATDINGEFVILNVPVGSYAAKCSYIGYRTVVVSNVRVNVDLTTEINFDMPTEAIEVGTVEIIAERPLVNKNATNNQTVRTSDEIQNLPIRSYAQMVNISAGVVSTNDNTYIRGGRAEETAYYVDGVYQNNLRTGAQTGDVSQGALEEVSVQVGGFNAEYGFASSGVVNVVTKTGGPGYNLFGEYITDEWLSQESKNLGTYSYGYNLYNLALSGPVPFISKAKFYISGERDFLRDRTPSAGTYPVLVNRIEPRSKSAVPPDSIDVVRAQSGPTPNNALGRWLVNGNILLDFNQLKLKIGGNSTRTDWRAYTTAYSLYNRDHNPLRESFSQSYYAKLTHALSSNTIYTAQINYFADGNEDADPFGGRDLINYGDKTDFNNDGIFNPNLRSQGLNVTRDGNTANLFDPAGVVYDEYEFNRSSYVGGRLDATHQIGRVHELKVGGEFRSHTLRRYYIGQPMELASTFANDPNVKPEVAYRGAYTDAYGYKLVQNPGANGEFVEENSSEFDKAKNPILFAVYGQDKIEVADLVLNLGLRVDYFDANDYVYKDPNNIVLTQDQLLDRSQLVASKSSTTLSPRLGLAFPVTDRTVFYGQFGRFTQQPPLYTLYTGWDYIANQLVAGNQTTQANPELKPTKTTSYEVGFRQQVGDVAALDITAYYKETRDLIVLESLNDARPIPYQRYANGDFGTIKGLSFNFGMRRTSRVAANLAYTLQYAAATGSTANTGFYVGWLGGDYPTFVSATDFDQRHTGSFNLDIRFNKDDGPTFLGGKVLGDLGLNFLATFGSGFAYTPRNVGDTVQGPGFSTSFPRGAINSAYGPWQMQVDMRLDKSFALAGVKFNAYLWALNLFNQRNMSATVPSTLTGATPTSSIYGATGTNYDDGYLDSPDGKNWIDQNGGNPAADLRGYRTDALARWSIPRQLRLGLRFDLNP